MKVIKLKREPIYFSDIRIIIGTKEEFSGYMWDHYKVRQELGSDASGYSNYLDNVMSGSTHYFVWLSEWRNTLFDYEVLAHEMFHIMCHIFAHLGIRVDNTNSEPAAYFLGYIFGNAIEKISIWWKEYNAKLKTVKKSATRKKKKK